MSVVLRANGRSGTVIVLHGLGDSGHGWAPVAREWQMSLPHLKFVLPHAPSQPVTLNGGAKMPSWHDIKSLEKIDAEDFNGLEESRKIVSSFIDEEIKAGVPSDRIVVAGFSQGAAMSVVTGYQYSQKLAGVVCMSGYLPFNGDFGKAISDANKTTPALVCHGDSDEVVNPKAGDLLFKRLTEAGVPADKKTYKGMGHSSCPEEMNHVAAFLGKLLPPQ